MISVEEAQELLVSNLPDPRVEQMPFQSSLGYVLAGDLRATRNVPPFLKSSMDGYALIAADVESTPVELKVVGKSRAGGGMPGRIKNGEAMSIMTGAPMPGGADAVQIVEKTQISADGKKVTILEPVEAGANVVEPGFEAKEGEIVIPAGRLIGPAEIAVMATFGHCHVKVYGKPSVALLATGDELVEFHETPRMDQIRNSNAYCLINQLLLLGIQADYLGIARDDRDELRSKILSGLQHDVLIITGGVSMGEYDLVNGIFRELEFKVLFSKVAIRPGKPTVFARKGQTLIFGLPGNPVSALIAFECFVRPALGRMSGMKKAELPRMQGELLSEVRQIPGRTAFLPAWAFWEKEGWKVEPLPWKNSADIIGFARANATFIFPREKDLLRRGDRVELMLLPDFVVRQR